MIHRCVYNYYKEIYNYAQFQFYQLLVVYLPTFFTLAFVSIATEI